MTQFSFSSGGTSYYDLTTRNGNEAAIGDGLFLTQASPGSSGTGLIQSFVRVQASGDEEGYNTSDRALVYDELTSATFTHDLFLISVPKVLIGTTLYYEFRLDINQTNNNSLVSLDQLKLYKATVGDGIGDDVIQGAITGTEFTEDVSLVYDMDALANNTILLDYGLQAGSGKSDMYFYVPVANFGGADEATTKVVLYSQFGATGSLSGANVPANLAGDYASNDGFEEWAVSLISNDPLISGYKWHDVNGNGLWDTSETALGGWKFDYTLSYKDGNGANAPLITVNGTTTTDASGLYYISVPLGAANNTTYTLQVTEVFPDDLPGTAFDTWVNTYDGFGTADGVLTYVFTENQLAAGTVSGTLGLADQMNFGNFKYMNVSGYKWEDHNGNSAWDEADAAVLSGWTIVLDNDTDASNGFITSAVTDAQGKYSFKIGPTTDADGVLHVYELVSNPWVKTYGGYSFTIASGLVIAGDVGEAETGNFGNFELFDLNGRKYDDINGDGQTTGDPGLGGIRVFIDMDGSATFTEGDISTFTSSDPNNLGYWEFNDLNWTVAGKTVYEVLPSGYVQTLGNLGYTVAGTSGTSQMGLNFANFELFDISGKKVIDTDGDGVVEAGETTAHAGVTIYIDLNDNGEYDAATDQATTTGADGTWSFTNLGVGFAGKKIYEFLPTGSDYVQTVGMAGFTITGTSGADQSGLTFANFERYDISGRKVTDITGNGLSGDDTGLGGVTVFIDVNGDDIDNDGYSTLTSDGSVDTNGDGDIDDDDIGLWSFKDLDWTVAGKEVKEITPFGFVQTVGQIGAVTDTEYLITGTSGTDQTGLNFANFEKFTIDGTKYTDVTGNGKSDDDTGLGDVTIFIDVNGNDLDDDGYSTVTAVDGSWSIANLTYAVAGKEVKEITPNGYVQTVGQVGTITDTSGTHLIVGTSGSDQGGFDFANFEKFTISGTKYEDRYGDGIDGGDGGYGGVTIFIDVNNNNLNDDGYSAITAANGSWSIANLTYAVAGKEVKEITPDGSVQTVGQVGTVLDTSGINIITGTSGADQGKLDFANFDKFDVSGYKFVDTNGDGDWDAGEATKSGWTIYLRKDTDNNGSYETLVDTKQTGADGAYSFTDLTPGKYQITEDASNADWINTSVGTWTFTGESGVDLSAALGATTAGNFGNFERFDVSGKKVIDTDGDGVIDAGETTGHVGVTIYIDMNNNGAYDVGTDQATLTGAGGAWAFNDLGTGYIGKKIYEHLPTGSDYVQTFGNAGYTITGTSGANQTGLMFANFEKFDISGYKWADVNNNADWDEATSAVLGGWVLYLDNDTDPTNGYVATTTTAADGSYSFDDITPADAGADGILHVYEQLQDGFTQTYGNFSFAIASGVDIVGDLGETEQGNFGNHMMGGANRTPGFWQSGLGQSFYDGIDTNNGDANGDGIVDGEKNYNEEGWSEVDLLTKYGVDTNADGKNDKFLVYSDGVAGVTGGDILLTSGQLADWVGSTGTSLEMLERAVGAAFLNTLNNHSISEADGDATGNAFDLFTYMDNEIEDSYLAAIAFIKKFDDGNGPGQYDNSGIAWDGETNANKKQQQTDWNAYGNAAHSELAAFNENGDQSLGGKMVQFKMDGDDYSSKLVQDYLAVQQQATLYGSSETLEAMAGSNYKFSDMGTLHLV